MRKERGAPVSPTFARGGAVGFIATLRNLLGQYQPLSPQFLFHDYSATSHDHAFIVKGKR
jgi:hypothetical protein